MKNKGFNLFRLIDKIFKLHLESSEKEVNVIKDDANNKVEEVRITLEQAGKLQTKVLRKTTTYYLGKAAGVIK